MVFSMPPLPLRKTVTASWKRTPPRTGASMPRAARMSTPWLK
jgi:hypothetical protein